MHNFYCACAPHCTVFFFEKRIKVNQRLIEPFGGKSRDLKNDLGFLLQQKRCRKEELFLSKTNDEKKPLSWRVHKQSSKLVISTDCIKKYVTLLQITLNYDTKKERNIFQNKQSPKKRDCMAWHGTPLTLEQQ